MTIEFLRARLLAERSVSRSARQRAEELAKRVCIMLFSVHVVSFILMFKELEMLSLSLLLPAFCLTLFDFLFLFPVQIR